MKLPFIHVCWFTRLDMNHARVKEAMAKKIRINIDKSGGTLAGVAKRLRRDVKTQEIVVQNSIVQLDNLRRQARYVESLTPSESGHVF